MSRILLIFFCISANVCKAKLLFEAGGLAGTMVQPSGSYYHLVYGSHISVSSSQERFIVRFQHWERPIFKASGFIDQDFGHSITIGSKLSQSENHGIYTLIGWSHLQGYIKEDPAESSQHSDIRRGFKMQGPSLLAFYKIHWNFISIDFGHQLSVGLGDSDQLDAYIAWPFSFLWLGLGVIW